MHDPTPATIRTYKARRGRLGATRELAMVRLAERLVLPVDGTPVDPAIVFGRRAPLVLEIGSGMGETTVAMAAADPDRDLIAVEVHTPGIAALLVRVEEAGLTNVRVARGDGLVLLRTMLGPGSLDEVRVFFPDPWPKLRHAKRRLVTAAFADLVADRLRPGGVLHVATDAADYAEQARVVLAGHPSFTLGAGTSRPRTRPVTRYERRGLDAGRSSADLVAVRRPAQPPLGPR